MESVSNCQVLLISKKQVSRGRITKKLFTNKGIECIIKISTDLTESMVII